MRNLGKGRQGDQTPAQCVGVLKLNDGLTASFNLLQAICREWTLRAEYGRFVKKAIPVGGGGDPLSLDCFDKGIERSPQLLIDLEKKIQEASTLRIWKGFNWRDVITARQFLAEGFPILPT